MESSENPPDKFLAAYGPGGPCRGQCFKTVRQLLIGKGEEIRRSYLVDWLTVEWQPTQGEVWTGALNPEAVGVSDRTRQSIESALRAAERNVHVRGCYRPGCVCTELEEVPNSVEDTVEEIPVTEIEQKTDGRVVRTWTVIVTATTRHYKGRCNSVPLEVYVDIVRPA